MKMQAYINGVFVDAPKQVEIISPLDFSVAGSVPSLTADHIDQAFLAARNAFKKWRDLKQSERTWFLREFIKELNQTKDELANIMRQEIGKDIEESKVEIERTIDYIKATIDSWKNIQTKVVDLEKKESTQTRVPLGVVLAISPFNYPINLALSKIAPALLVGNTVVYKAATNGSLTGAFITKLFDKVNIPAGVFNYVSGRGSDIGDILTSHKEIDMVSFTGSVSVGKRIAQNIHMKPLVLELGGNDAAYVRNDADLELASKEIIGGAFGYSGQRCTAIKRVIAHEDVSNGLVEKLVNMVKEVKEVPLITQKAADFVKDLFDDAISKNAEVLTGGEFNKNLVTATIIKTTPDSRAWKEEAFGPLLPIMVVKNDEEAIRIMNDTNYGLQNSIFTKDIKWVKEIATKIESGTLNINAKSSRGPDIFPFSGIKDSGFGTQGIDHALESMTRILNIVYNK